MPQLLCFLLAVVLICGAALVRGSTPGSVPELGRSLVRPAVLPVLWRSLRTSRQEGGTEEQVARGRLLLRFLPQWTDGHIHFAWRLAFDASQAQADPKPALQRLLAGLAFLENALSSKPTRPVEILEAMSQIVQIRCRDEALARAFREQLQEEPASFADRCLLRAQKIDHSQVRAEHRVLVRTGLIAGQLRTNNRSGALELLDATLRGLETFRDPQLRADWGAALRDLRSYLHGNAELKDLEKHPQLDEILRALGRQRNP